MIKKSKIKILAIETSCDETAASVVEIIKPINYFQKNCGRKKSGSKYSEVQVKILSNVVSSQVKIHAKYGGVYPELASREHVKNIIPVIQAALEESGSMNQELCQKKNSKFIIHNSLFKQIDYIAVTTGPGLIGSLLVGVNTAKTLAYSFNKPIIPVNHLEGHIYANFINEISIISNYQFSISKQIQNNSKKLKSYEAKKLPEFPILALVVSGGHTQLVYMKKHLDYKLIGETYDDAAGEAYDKVAAMLGLDYPGGPIIDAIASQVTSHKSQVTNLFPRPMINENNFDFSFSGLKTSVLYYLKKQKKPFSKKLIQKVCYEFQEAVTDVLIAKTLKAAQKYKVKSILLGGGVAANSCLREKFKIKIKNLKLKIDLKIPPIKRCTDNAAVIGIAAAYKIIAGDKSRWYTVNADSNLKLD